MLDERPQCGVYPAQFLAVDSRKIKMVPEGMGWEEDLAHTRSLFSWSKGQDEEL
jgi:hypothetical protein